MTTGPWPQPDLQARLVAYGLALFGQAAGHGTDPAIADWAAYAQVLGATADAPPDTAPAALASPFSFLQTPPDSDQPATERPLLAAPVYYLPGLLDGQATEPGPGSLVPVAGPLDSAALRRHLEQAHDRFLAAWADVQARQGTHAAPLDRFLELYRAFAWAVPAPTVRPTVSLYQFFKSVCALAVCALIDEAAPSPPAGPLPAEVLLVAGDIPGIQTMIYTVAAAAAAKGLRGRSAYVQLLADAVVRRVRTALDLPAAHVVYIGGGKFLLLAPLALEKHLPGIQAALDAHLLAEFRGDLSVVLATHRTPVAALGTPDFATHLGAVHTALQIARQRRFSSLLGQEQGYRDLFVPPPHPVEASASGVCLVCQKPLSAAEWQRGARREGDPEGRVRCAQCVVFEELAATLGRAHRVVIGAPGGAEPHAPDRRRFIIAGIPYDFGKPGAAASGTTLILNGPTFWPHADGFWQIANTTPFVQAADIAAYRVRHPRAATTEIPREHDVKDFHQLAEQAAGVKRVGLLRMDVDSLGDLLTRGFQHYDVAGTPLPVGAGDPALTLPALATLSQLLGLFFDTRVPALCAAVDAEDNPAGLDTLYVIYSGGDDLFVVGAWDRVVTLARRVRAAFGVSTGGSPYLGLSGAVTLEGAKFPLYRAAERAGAAEDAAKDHRREEEAGDTVQASPRPWAQEKDAFAFLGQVAGWDEFAVVERWQERFCRWIAQSGPGTTHVPRALVQLVIRIDALHRETRRGFYLQHQARVRSYLDVRGSESARRHPGRFPRNRVYHGRWLWMLSYSLTRFAHRMPRGALRTEVEAAIKELQADVLRPRMIELVGLAARWSELLLRNKEDRA